MSKTTGYQDGKYDAVREAEKIWRTNPQKYNSESKHRSYHRTTATFDNNRQMRQKINLVVEHWSGCSGQSVCDDIRLGVEDNFPDVKFVEVTGRFDSFEVFINGKLLYSRISQGGYPYTEEVLDAVMRAKEGMKFRELERGSSTCTVL